HAECKPIRFGAGHAKQAAALLACSQRPNERLAECGLLSAKKYGRGWSFVTAQLLHHVIAGCACNLIFPDAYAASGQQYAHGNTGTLSRPYSPVSSRTHAPPPLEPFQSPERRGRPRRHELNPKCPRVPSHVSLNNAVACEHPAYLPHVPAAPTSTPGPPVPSDTAPHAGHRENEDRQNQRP